MLTRHGRREATRLPFLRRMGLLDARVEAIVDVAANEDATVVLTGYGCVWAQEACEQC